MVRNTEKRLEVVLKDRRGTGGRIDAMVHKQYDERNTMRRRSKWRKVSVSILPTTSIVEDLKTLI